MTLKEELRRKEQSLFLLLVLFVHALLFGLLVIQRSTVAPAPFSIELSLAAAEEKTPQIVRPTMQNAALQPGPVQRQEAINTPVARTDSTPTMPMPLAPTAAAPATALPPVVATPASPSVQVPIRTAAPPVVPASVLPNSDAAYLTNPKPGYPPLSRRLGEQGVVTLSVLVGTNGEVQQLDIAKSSGYSRLDEAARKAVSGWRFVPGKLAGVAEAMWVKVPISFILEK
jgi:protein TonB